MRRLETVSPVGVILHIETFDELRPRYRGSNFLRQRLVLSTVSGRPVVITDIRVQVWPPGVGGFHLVASHFCQDEEPGLRDYEAFGPPLRLGKSLFFNGGFGDLQASFVRLLDKLCDGQGLSFSNGLFHPAKSCPFGEIHEKDTLDTCWMRGSDISIDETGRFCIFLMDILRIPENGMIHQSHWSRHNIEVSTWADRWWQRFGWMAQCRQSIFSRLCWVSSNQTANKKSVMSHESWVLTDIFLGYYVIKGTIDIGKDDQKLVQGSHLPSQSMSYLLLGGWGSQPGNKLAKTQHKCYYYYVIITYILTMILINYHHYDCDYYY